MNMATYHFVCYLYLLYGLFLFGKSSLRQRKRRKHNKKKERNGILKLLNNGCETNHLYFVFVFLNKAVG
jgi:hypothetical protein